MPGAKPVLCPLPINQVLCRDALTGLRQLPDECIDCVVTSPPYWNLRDYDAPEQLCQSHHKFPYK